MTDKKQRILENVISGVIIIILGALFSWLAPQINIEITWGSLTLFVLGLYLAYSFNPIKQFLENAGFINFETVTRITGGLFWLFLGVLIFTTSEIDTGTRSLTNADPYFIVGVLMVVVGSLQITNRYELAGESIGILIYGPNYRAKNKWEKIIQSASEDIDYETKTKILVRASEKLKKSKENEEIDRELYSQIVAIKKTDENLTYAEFNKKYLKKGYGSE